MKRLKAIASLALAATMVFGLAACGSKGGDTAATTGSETSGEETAAVELASDGQVLNIYCWNEEFKSRVTDHYPGYEEVDATTGKIGDVTVKWNITSDAIVSSELCTCVR